MTHTPGPWYVGKYGDNDSDVCAVGGPVICALRSGKADPHDMEADADAALIAAAPELLAVLTWCADRWDKYDEDDAPELGQAIRDAIAKAAGRE
jgi:hypothetical protein